MIDYRDMYLVAYLIEEVFSGELGEELCVLLPLGLLLHLGLLRPQPRDPAHVVGELQLGDEVVLGALEDVLGAVLSPS